MIPRHGVVARVAGRARLVDDAASCAAAALARAMDAATASSIARALEDAARTANGARGAARDGASRAALAREAHEKLGFDYPLVRDEEVRALAAAMRDAARAEGGLARTPFALTRALARNAREGGGASDARDDGENGGDGLGDAFRNLRAAVYVEVPRAVMRMSDDDAFEALRAYAPEEHEAETETEAETPRETLANGANGATANAPIVSEPREDGDDDDDAWEPVESTVSWFAPAKDDARYANMSKREVVNAKLRSLMNELLPARVGATSTNVGVNSDWERLDVASGLMDLFESMCASCDVERRALRTIPLRALRERWAIAAGGKLGVEAGLTRALDALKFAQSDAMDEQTEDHRIALELLAYLCLRFGAETMGVQALGEGENSASSARSKLWAHVHRAIPVVTKTLEHSLRVMDARKEDPDWQDTVGLSALLIAFYTTNASAALVKDVGERLLRTGCLRALVNIFIALHRSPLAETVRRALLMSTLACDGVYEFVSRVSGVHTALAGAEFSFDGAFAMHGAMWKIALREPDAESHLAKCLDRFASTLDDEASVLGLRDGLLLTRASERAAKASGRQLFKHDGHVTTSLKSLSANVVDVITTMARARDEHAHAIACDDDEEKKRAENPNAPIVEKRREAIVEISRKLKILLASDDSTVIDKAD